MTPEPGALIQQVLGDDLTAAVEVYDGTRLGPPDAPATIRIRTPDAFRRIVTAPGELGFGRAYVAGDLEIEGDIFAALELRDALPQVRLSPAQMLAAVRMVGTDVLRPLPPPPEEARLHGRRHSRGRDAAAIAHHYDVSNEFYEILLGPSLTYSCAVWPTDRTTLVEAQAAKHELICRKLGLRPGMRLLDIGCGWGSLVLHAAMYHGVDAVGVTVSSQQVELARKRIADAGLEGRVEVRLQDYRDVADGPFDAISSVGMFEHVGLSQLGEYFGCCRQLLAPQGRLLNHGISRPPADPTLFDRLRRLPLGDHLRGRSFIDRYVFPDGELHEIGTVVSALQDHGLEVRHVESLREHYARTCRAWVANLEARWNDAVAEVGAARARVWRLYLAGSAMGFEAARIAVHQVLAVVQEDGRSGMPPRPAWDAEPLV